MKEDRMEDRVKVTETKVGTLHGSEDLVLRFMYKPPAPAAKPKAGATPSLQLTPLQARHLMLLLGQALGFPNSDIPGSPTPPVH